MVNVGAVITSPLPTAMPLPQVADLAREAEAAGLDCIWVEDLLAFGDAPVLDGTLVMAAAAAATKKIEVGSAVFVPSMRNISWALKQVATLALIAGRRLQLGVGLGAATEDEYALAGMTRAGQGQRTDEFLGVLTAVRRGDEAEVPVTTRALLVSPAVPLPQLWVGGTSSGALRRAARFGDGWLSGLQTPAEFEVSLAHLRRLAEEEGRPCPSGGIVTRVAIGAGPARDLAAGSCAAMQSNYGLSAERAEELAIAGTPEQVAEALSRYIDAGAARLALISDVLPWSESWPMLAEVRHALHSR